MTSRTVAGRTVAGANHSPAWAGAGRAAPAALVLAAFAAVGVAVVDDFGVAADEASQRFIGQAVINSVLPGAAGVPADRLIHHPEYGYVLAPHDRYYGAAFEAPLVLVEPVLGLVDSRAVFLSRRLLTHLFFLTGGWFCYLLTCRLFGDRRLALFALLLFLLHPRLYAHSFFNTKDLPFLAAFMIALYLLERAFRRDTAAAFALCGVAVGVLVNLRVMGVMLFAAAAGLRALDLALARGPAERRRALVTAAAFVLAAAGTLYALSPYLWRDPLAIVDAVTTLARHPTRLLSLFRGEPVRWPSIPPHYLPAWMAITTPPATLLLCLTGAAAVVRRGIARPGGILRNGPVRFAWLLLACLALPPVAVAALQANVYSDWRHGYFLYAPACLLAAYGLRALLAAARRVTAAPAREKGGVWRRGLWTLTAAALIGMVVDVVRLHPFQYGYFNALVDRRTPEYLRTQYSMLHYGSEVRDGLEYLLARFPGATLRVDSNNRRNVWNNSLILPAEQRRRIVIADAVDRSPQFFITRGLPDDSIAPVLYTRRIYRNTVLAVTAVDLSLEDAAAADGYHAAYRAAVAGAPLVRSQFDLYFDGAALTYVKEPCGPEDIAHRFLLRAVPETVEDLPVIHRARGWQPLDFRFGRYGVRFDGRCLIRRPLPGYPIRTLEVGRWLRDVRNLRQMEAAVDLRAGEPSARRRWPASPHWQTHAAIAAGERGAPAARAALAGHAAPTRGAAFELYLDAAGAELAYHKEPCAPEELRDRFYLHVFPADPAELAAHERQSGFYNHGFFFAEHGVLLPGGACVALVPLPAWERGIARIRTSQANGWSAEFAPK